MIATVIIIAVVTVDLEKICSKMRNPPKTKIELIDMENSDENPVDLAMSYLDESENSEDSSEDYEEGTSEGIPVFTVEASEIISRAHSFIAHEQETLDEKLDEIIFEFGDSTENDMLRYLTKCFKIIDDLIMWANQFLDQAIEKRIFFRGFYYEMHDDAEIAINKTLTIISILEEKNLFSLIPIVEDLTSEIDQIKILVSNTTLEQVEETLKNYASQRSLNRRKIEDFKI
jgi:hypothetical protein